MIISKALDKVQHQFMITNSQQLGIEKTYLNIIKATCDKPRSNIILNGEKLKIFPQGQRQDEDAHSHSFNQT